MDFKIYHLPSEQLGNLYMFPAPLPSRVPAYGIEQLKDKQINIVVNLLGKKEYLMNKMEMQQETYQNAGISIIHYPIEDFGTPTDSASFRVLLHEISTKVKDGMHVGVHCMAGIGRSTVFMASLLVELGMSLEDAINHISHHRAHEVPDTQKQVDWLTEFNSR